MTEEMRTKMAQRALGERLEQSLAGLPMHPVMRHWIDDALASAPERLFAQP